MFGGLYCYDADDKFQKHNNTLMSLLRKNEGLIPDKQFKIINKYNELIDIEQ